MSETLTFGPEWLRALSSGNSVTSPPPSPGPKYKLAEYRYGKEEMLAMFAEEVKIPDELKYFDFIQGNPQLPLAFVPLTEEEQRCIMGSVNSNAVLKVMGRGGPRGAPRGGIRGSRGRGRGEGPPGYMRQSSYEDGRGDGGGFGHVPGDTQRQSWGEPRTRGGFGDPPRGTRESGPGRGGYDPNRGYDPSRGHDPSSREHDPSSRGYDPSLARPRLSSDSSWDRSNAGHSFSSDNWRSKNEEDGGGWRVSGQRSPEKTERWRGSSRGRGSWSNNRESYQRSSSYQDDEWQVARGSRRSFREEDVKWNEHVPEWSNDDSVDFKTVGTFDSSGAFMSEKKQDGERNKDDPCSDDESAFQKNDSEKSEDWGKEDSKTPDKQKIDTNILAESEKNKSSTINKDKTEKQEKPPENNIPPLTQQKSPVSVTKSPPATSPSSDSKPSPAPLENSQEQKEPPPSTPTPPSDPVKASHTSVTPSRTKHTKISPSVSAPPQSKTKKPADDEINMEHLTVAAENLVASLDDEEEKPPPSSPAVTQPSPPTVPSPTESEVQWFYTDPQGKMQGPFSNSEMADWFSHGYFTMNLLVRRSVDEAFQPLGELIKRWGRVPFLPGTQPPPFKGVPEHIQQQQQQFLAQQQYQQLMQQHYLQQQFLQQQALMTHHIQQLQASQLQQPPPHTHSPPGSTPSQTPTSQPTPDQGETTQIADQPNQPNNRPQNLQLSPDSIWGPTTSNQTTPSVVSPGPWSPAATPPAARVWDMETSKKKVQSFEEIQKIEEAKEREAKMKIERQEAEARAVRQKQEEEERRRQHKAMLQRQEEERRRQLEEAEKKRREQEEILRKQQEEAYRKKQEEELRKRQQQETMKNQQELQRQQEAERQKRLEEKKMNELRQQQQQALLRLRQQQQELQRRKELQQQLELQQHRELQQKLQQKRQHTSNGNGQLWGAPPPTSSAPSLAEIQQQQEDRERRAQEQRIRQLQVQQQQQQQQARAAAAASGWGEKRVSTNNQSTVKSLLQIQEEQARQQAHKREQQAPQLSRSHPTNHNPLSSSVWSNTGPLSSSWTAGSEANVWGSTGPKPQTHSKLFIDEDEDDDDDDDDDDEEESFWDECVKVATRNSEPTPRQAAKQQSSVNTHSSPSPSKSAAKRVNKDEIGIYHYPDSLATSSLPQAPGWSDHMTYQPANQLQSHYREAESVRRLFQQQSANVGDEFGRWCDQALRSLHATNVDIPTFVAFLQEVDSPYEVHDYVKSYLGDTRQTNEFAKEFIERRKKHKSSRLAQSTHIFPQANVWGTQETRVTGGGTGRGPCPYPYHTQQTMGPSQDDASVFQDVTGKKKSKKKRMQKVNPNLLGFSVNAADRVNMGEIQTLEDA